MWKITLALIGLISSASLQNVDYTPMNKFGLRLLNSAYRIQETNGVKNMAISPLSLWNIFSLLAEGSSGETYSELLNTMQLPNNLEELQALHSAVSKTLKYDSKEVTVNGQSLLISNNSVELHPKFYMTALSYDTGVRSVDSEDTVKLAEDINNYVQSVTQGKISHVVKPENLENLKMILIDSLYFKGHWADPFSSRDTKEEAFYNSEGIQIGTVNMMHHEAPHNFENVHSIGAKVLELTYGNSEDFAMLILLPFDGVTIKTLLHNLEAQPLTWLKEFRVVNPYNVKCYVPRFELTAQMNMIPPLQSLGVYSIFDNVRADLPGISSTPLYVSRTTQNVFLKVTEQGTEAAAVTFAGVTDKIVGGRSVEVNKEFVFLIVDRRSDIILFAGVYGDPSLV